MNTEHQPIPIEEFFGKALKFPVSVKNLFPNALKTKPMMLAPATEPVND